MAAHVSEIVAYDCPRPGRESSELRVPAAPLVGAVTRVSPLAARLGGFPLTPSLVQAASRVAKPWPKNAVRDGVLREDDHLNRDEKKLQKHFAQQALGLAARKQRQKESRLRKAMRPAAVRERLPVDPAVDWDDLELPWRERNPKRSAQGTAELRTPSGGAPSAGELANSQRFDGVALGLAGGWLRVWRAGESVLARRPGAFPGPPPVVGDEVELAQRDGEFELIAMAPRRTQLVRSDPHVGARPRVVAANVDTVVIVVPAGPPPPRLGLVDRISLAIGRGGGAPLVCLSKLDLAPADGVGAMLRRLLETGTALVACSARTGEGIAELALRLARGRAVLVGQSGSGKTSLVNALVPGLALPTAAVRRSDGKGRHTTSAATLVELPGGGQLLDTPGVRQFGLWSIGEADVRRHFEDIARLAVRCRFRDCGHRGEPQCAVRDAEASGELAPARYRAYLRLLEECEP